MAAPSDMAWCDTEAPCTHGPGAQNIDGPTAQKTCAPDAQNTCGPSAQNIYGPGGQNTCGPNAQNTCKARRANGKQAQNILSWSLRSKILAEPKFQNTYEAQKSKYLRSKILIIILVKIHSQLASRAKYLRSPPGQNTVRARARKYFELLCTQCRMPTRQEMSHNPTNPSQSSQTLLSLVILPAHSQLPTNHPDTLHPYNPPSPQT